MDDPKGNNRQIVGQPTSEVHEQVTLDDLKLARSFFSRAGLVSGEVLKRIHAAVETTRSRSEEQSFRNGREIL